MPLTDATLTSLGNSLATLATHLSLHTADPGATGANPATSARVAATWTVDSDGDLTTGPKAFSGGASNGPVLWVGLWSAITGGTFRGAFPITGDATFNSTGDYTLTLLTINGTST